MAMKILNQVIVYNSINNSQMNTVSRIHFGLKIYGCPRKVG